MITTTSPAKINWFLLVLRKRADGYHEIITALQKVSLFDRMTFRRSEELKVIDEPNIPGNIIYKALNSLQKHRPFGKSNFEITLKKEIPVAAGLGGGSSNAAITLKTLNQLLTLGLSGRELLTIGSEIGSDVPFFLGNTFAIAKGRGELLTSRRIGESYDILLVNPGIEISAAWAYQNTRKYFHGETEQSLASDFIDALEKRDFSRMDAMMVNSLEGTVIQKFPVIQQIKDDMKRFGAKVSMMSGSGSTVFGVFEDKERAETARKHFHGVWSRVVRTMI